MSYHSETYPTSVDVRVTWRDQAIGVDSIEDSIKGEDVTHALERAAWNWPGAEIEMLGLSAETEEAMYAEYYPGETDEWADAATWSATGVGAAT